jgi:hypothetical protein
MVEGPAHVPHLHAPPIEDDDPDRRVQMNVRLPHGLVTTIDLRRNALGLSRDEWVRRALTFALLDPDGSPRAIRAMNGHRTANRRLL